MQYSKPCALRSGALGLSVLVAMSCTGAIDGERNGDSKNGEPAIDPVTGLPIPNSGGTAGSGGTGATGTPLNPGAVVPPERQMSTVCKGIDPGPSFVRRLTKREYNNTVRDLLGDTSAPGSSFPVEEQVEGFDNNALNQNVSPVLLEQYLSAAGSLAGAAVDKIIMGLACDPATAGENTCVQKFIDTFVRRAFRRPAAPEEVTLLQGVFTAGKANGGFRNGIRLAMMEALMSPPFLYRIELGGAALTGSTGIVQLTHYEMASRLSYLLWNSMPDDALFQAAAAGKLGTRDEVKAQVTRMLADPKARDVTKHFYEQWFDFDRMDGVSKDAKLFPTFNPTVGDNMKSETLAFVEDLTWKDGDLTALFTAQFTMVNATLAKYYGLTTTSTSTSTYSRIAVDGTKRAGLLTQGSILTMFSHGNQTSPVLRGKFVREQLLCVHPPAPPNDLVVELPKLSTTLTTRERYARHATEAACTGCHSLMDPIGLGFENFDAVGLWRDAESGKPIDASGEVTAMASGAIKFSGAVDLGRKLAATEEVASCLAVRWFQYGYGRAQTEADACSLDVLKRGFVSKGRKLRGLLETLTETDAFLFRRAIAPGGVQ